MKVRVSGESIVLVMICLADMLSTLFFVLRGSAVEQNPIMAACLDKGPWVFVLVKIASFVPFVVAVELYRKRNAAFARLACRSAIIIYVVTFTVLTVGLNV
ncbi:MAG: hypothetical protein GX141_07555 [Armatimonadetes bacterium]|nr:hypothetical protein [Armatimonadota bacterium]